MEEGNVNFPSSLLDSFLGWTLPLFIANLPRLCVRVTGTRWRRAGRPVKPDAHGPVTSGGLRSATFEPGDMAGHVELDGMTVDTSRVCPAAS